MGKNIIEDISNIIYFSLFIKYVLPIILLIAAIIFGYQFLYGMNTRNQYNEQDNIIFTSKYKDTVSEKAKEIYNKEVFSEIKIDKVRDTMFQADMTIEYTFIDQTKTAAEYDTLIKTEITNLYNSLKDYKLVIDNSYEKEAVRNIRLVFNYNWKYLIDSFVIKSTDKTVFDEESYQSIINSTIITEEELNDPLKFGRQ